MASINSFDLSLQGSGSTPNIEPKRKYNFTLELEGIPTLLVRSFPLPSVSIGEIEIPYGNERTYIAGRVTYEAGELVLMDDINSDGIKSVLAWRGQIYNPTTGAIQIAGSYKKQGTVTQYSPDGEVITTWTLIGAWPQNANYGDASQDDEAYNTVSITIRYDKAFSDQNSSAI